jgi:hypothetical protein
LIDAGAAHARKNQNHQRRKNQTSYGGNEQQTKVSDVRSGAKQPVMREIDRFAKANHRQA